MRERKEEEEWGGHGGKTVGKGGRNEKGEGKRMERKKQE